MIAQLDNLNLDVFRRFSGLSLPRHVSYPMPSWWTDVSQDTARSMWNQSRKAETPRDLSLYLHIPFCERLCKYCACTRLIQNPNLPTSTARTQRYLDVVENEIRRMKDHVGHDRVLRQIHWGGGSPTYLEVQQIERLQNIIRDAFNVAADAEIAIEIDPRITPPETIASLRDFGFNRASLGVQDFNLRVQQHVHRIQPYELVRQTVEACRACGFESINFDLIYGMPFQTTDTIRDTIDQVITLSPDRVAFYHYAQIPEKIATQRGMDYTQLPDSETKLEMYITAVHRFEDAGYEFVGLDHFAKSTEQLSVARRTRKIQRNFQGMTTGGGLDLLGVGVSSISHLIGIGFLQNEKDFDQYLAHAEQTDPPTIRGKQFTRDDCIRQAVINQIYCDAAILPGEIADQFGISFQSYFARELDIIKQLQLDGLVTIDHDGDIRLTRPLGRVLMRNVAAVFDAYLQPNAYRNGQPDTFSANA